MAEIIGLFWKSFCSFMILSRRMYLTLVEHPKYLQLFEWSCEHIVVICIFFSKLKKNYKMLICEGLGAM